MSVRAGIVVTGTEVLAGIIRDENGPWLSERLRDRGVQLVAVHVVGDRPDDLRAGLELFRELDLVITSGGLGPTADDLTADVVAAFAGVPMELDDALEERIWARISALSGRWRDVSDEALRAGNRKQALVPRGAAVLEPVGTAPGLIVPVEGGPVVLVLPGPPGELQPMWEEAVAVPVVRDVLARAGTFEQRIMRITGVPESQLAEVLREVGPASSLGDHDLPAAGRARDRDRLRPVRVGRLRGAGGGAGRSVRRARVLARRRHDRRHRRGAAAGAAAVDRGGRRVVHRRADGGAPDRPAGLLGLRAGRRGRLLERGEGRARGGAGGR